MNTEGALAVPLVDADEDDIDEKRERMENLIVRVPHQLRVELDELADARGRKLSKMIRWILRDAVRDLQVKWSDELERHRKKVARSR